jgi:adenylylsulfate kinase
MTEQKATNITWHRSSVTREDRQNLRGHNDAVLWFTGLSGSGKSTLAFATERALMDRACHSYVLDGDNVRHGMNKDLGFTPEDREENIRRIGEVAKLFADAGLLVMTAFISPYSRDREVARGLHTSGDEFVEVYCKCALSVCEERDPKGLYKKARAGEIRNFTGIDAPYEEPDDAEIIVDTDSETVEECVGKILAYLENKGVIPKK